MDDIFLKTFTNFQNDFYGKKNSRLSQWKAVPTNALRKKVQGNMI